MSERFKPLGRGPDADKPMRIRWPRWFLPTAALALIFVIGGVSGGLHVVAGMAAGIAVGVALVLAYGYLKRRLNR